ncbi:acyl-CoA dehydrogenase [Megasphaera sp. AM44-1BH]|uniref:acyl-CoA dehydrogenase n=1 Tax=Megasphaera sp. AM44-1BH TaxID=2292358 RepID=UPI000E46728D|nr:acyl-CoA dehydrogenase [Megasphaera sp. AM44-1BH]RHA09211.1 acyl-CoA dehydrogenase [Megasphaera sp. AM44-1BH]
MNFEFSDEQQAIQKLVREFAEKEIAPTVQERDEKAEFSREIFDKIGELGLCGIFFPEEYGGSDGSYVSYILANEELSKVDDAVAAGYASSISLCAWPIWKFGTEEQKKKYLTPLAEGTKLGAFGLTEPNAGSDAARQQSTAVRKGDHYILNGSKIFITNGGEADIYVVFAMTDKTKGTKGISAFILEKGMEGFSFGKEEQKMGIHASKTRELIFQDVKVPVENLLGEEGKGFKIAMQGLDGGRIGVAAQGLGIAGAALEAAIKYSKEREQFGKPVCKFQSISFMLADMATKLDAARLLVYRAAALKEQGKPYTKESCMAKLYATDAAMSIATDAVQILGGYGYIREYPVERLMRDAKITQIYEGTNQIQRLIISGQLLQ